ncbi:MAG: phosphatase PAP2 family protein, partial [bacterium]
QIIKRSTGRESPSTASAPGGVWRFFPDQMKYSKKVSRYDAFPTGHLATGMMTVTVISRSYPENRLIKPVGYTLLSLLSFQMVNNGVHWISDYPLGIAIGYAMGNIAFDSMNETGQGKQAGRGSNLRFLPFFSAGGSGIMAIYRI